MLSEQVERLLDKESKKTKTLQFAMNLPELGIRYSYSSTVPDQRFHSASVGKLMTSTLIFMLIEEGMIDLETSVESLLEPGMLNGLFVVDGHDFKEEVNVKHLLQHMSGVNDYFEGRTSNGVLFTEEIISNPDFFWTPKDLVDFTRNRQRPVGRPGEKFLYSDTGYVLLGLIVEKVLGMPFHQALDRYLFKPSGMKDTGLCFYSEGFDPKCLAPLYVNEVDIHLFRSLSCDFSGGGLYTTTEDLLKFLDELQNRRLISQASLDQMATFGHLFRKGLHYGTGMMQVRFEAFFFLLKSLPRLQGHLGITGVHAWYDPVTKGAFVLNVGSTREMTRSFKLLISILQLVQRAYRKR